MCANPSNPPHRKTMKEYIRLILILLIPLLLVSAYSVSGYRLSFNGWSVGKIRYWHNIMEQASLPVWDSQESNAGSPDITAGALDVREEDQDAPSVLDTVFAMCDSLSCESVPVDTCSKRILFLGDSMVEGLSMRFSDYAQENGHQLYSVCWYGSSTTGWAANLDTLASFLRWAEPDYVVVSLGGNELKVKDLDFRAANIKKIHNAMRGLPTVWIAPPSWVKNPTITEVIRTTVGDRRYFDSTRLTYTRGSDNMHPTFGSSSRWMDSIAVWMSSPQTEHPIRMNLPSRKYPRKWHKRFIYPD